MARHVFSMVDEDGSAHFKDVLENLDGAMTGKIINDVLWNEAGVIINDSIMSLLPVSGREWRGKKKAASKAKPFTQQNDPLSVTIKTKSAYHYLYFPDDGDDTLHHFGNQQFMLRGAEKVTDDIVERLLDRLIYW